MECVVIAAGLDVPSASSVKARKREELMISSDEDEDEYTSESDGAGSYPAPTLVPDGRCRAHGRRQG